MATVVMRYEEYLCIIYRFYTGGQLTYFIICRDLNLKHTRFF